VEDCGNQGKTISFSFYYVNIGKSKKGVDFFMKKGLYIFLTILFIASSAVLITYATFSDVKNKYTETDGPSNDGDNQSIEELNPEVDEPTNKPDGIDTPKNVPGTSPGTGNHSPSGNDNPPPTGGGSVAGGGSSGGNAGGGTTKPPTTTKPPATTTPPVVTHTVSFSLNGGSGSAPANRTCQLSQGSGCVVGALPGIGSAIRNGFAFTGWGVNTNCTNAVASMRAGAIYTTNQLTRTLYACWNPVFAQVQIAGTSPSPRPSITEGGSGSQNITISNVQTESVVIWLFHPNDALGVRPGASPGAVNVVGGRTRMTVGLPYDCRSGGTNLIHLAVNWGDGAGSRTYNLTLRGNGC